jgi:hypothetical protein
MANPRWALLESIQEKLTRLSDLPPEALPVIAAHLEEAISTASRAPLDALSKQLVDLFDRLLRLAPAEAIHAVRGSVSAESAEGAAYLLGQIGFAQLLASQAAEHRADDGFVTLIRDDRSFTKYIDALYGQDSTGVELSKISGECVETVSRKLKRLRELGITDFYREGTRVVNFLTPAARAIVEGARVLTQQAAKPEPPKTNPLISRLGDPPSHMGRRPSFTTPPVLDQAA